ncbi:hypothetical protein LCGC14_1940930 [marine sediment metagenome]|uniref:Uncharacterized protein n=1 Tax=marine sediment metagenome TaxID=412755 RepID=A0A0F9FKM0_9ZZZZ
MAWETYEREQQPGYLSVRDEFWFKPSTDDAMVYVWDEDQNVGRFTITDEQEDIQTTDTRIDNQATKRQRKWMKQVPVSFEAFKTDQVGKRQRIGQQIGDRARLTQDELGVLDTFGDAFDGSINTTPDGDAWASDSHTTISGGTVDNLETGALNADNLWITVQSLANQKAQDDEAGSYVFEGILVPFILYKTAKETMASQLVPFSAENQVNLFDTDYGTVRIAASIFLGSTYNGNSNANTSYHVVGQNHMNQRKVLSDLSMTLLGPEHSANDTYQYRARYMESTFPESWSAYVGNNGTA